MVPYLPTTAFETKWKNLRWLYRVGLLALLCLVAYCADCFLLFGKFHWISAQDYAPVIASRCMPIIRAIKLYERDEGQLPDEDKSLVPKYLKSVNGPPMWDYQYDERLCYFYDVGLANFPVDVVYRFDQGDEGWYHRAYFSGTLVQLPFPPMAVPPATRPARR
jgi:hypothetical protein